MTENQTVQPQSIFIDPQVSLGVRTSSQLDKCSYYNYFFDSDGQQKNGEENLLVEQKSQSQLYSFGDNWSILRFIKGLSLQITKGQSSKSQSAEELVLTNMVFYSGLHVWEINATISCNNLQIGVYNPITSKEILASFKTTTPRVITVCLDLNENMLKFWLNDRRNTNKNIKLPPNEEPKKEGDCQVGGPWIPCIKIDKEKNRCILNPYAREPSDFYEKDFDKKFNMNKYIMAHLFNMVLVTNLPSMSFKTKEVALQLKDLFELSSENIHQIIMYSLPNQTEESQIQQNQQQQTTEESKRFCFIQFNYWESMVEFFQKQKKDSKFQLFNAFEIAHLINKNDSDIPQELLKAIKLIREHINFPKFKEGSEGILETIEVINKAYQSIVINKEESKKAISNQAKQVDVTYQPFCDKLIVVRDQMQVKLISRDQATNAFDIQSSNFNETPQNLNSLATLKIQTSYLEGFFQLINWHQLLKEENHQMFGIIQMFFKEMLQNYSICQDMLVFRVSIIIARFFIEFATQQARSQLDRVRRILTNYTSVLYSNKKEQIQGQVKENALFYKDPNHSVEELFLILQMLSDLNEQLWAQTRNSRSSQLVKQLFTSISRPNSSLNRLGSFINWTFSSDSNINGDQLGPIQMAENGMLSCRDGGASICMLGNSQIEMNDISRKSLSNFDILQESLGSSNRILNGLVCENIPLYKSLNYLPPSKLQYVNQITSVISSQNSGYVLIGGQLGIVMIAHTLLDIVPMKTLSFFTSDIEKKQRKYKDIINKIEMRQSMIETYKGQIAKKSAPMSFSKDFKPKNDKNKQDQISKAEKKKNFKAQKLKNAKQAKKLAQEIAAKSKDGSLMSGKQAHPKKEKKIGSKGTDPKGQPQMGKSANQVKQEVELKSEKFDQNNVKIIGYILLSKPAYLKAIDPLLVGCVYQNLSTQKFYLKVRKIIFLLHYLQSFITLDPNSGQQIIKISGKAIPDQIETSQIYQEILNHHDNVVDLYSIFLRNQVLKKGWPKKDQKFQVLTDIYEAEIEIDNCQSIVDFTNCSYSVQNQSNIHFLIEYGNEGSSAKKVKLVQYNIEEIENLQTDISNNDDLGQDLHRIKIVKKNEKDVIESLNKVLQFDNSLILANNQSYWVVAQETFEFGEEFKFKNPIESSTSSKLSIINKTDPSKLFSKHNLYKYNEDNQVQQQDWKLVVETSKGEYEQYPLVKAQELGLISKQKTIKASSFNFKSLIPNDITQLGNLMECAYTGTIADKNDYSHLTSACLDTSANHFTHHSWQLLKQSGSPYEFRIKIPSKYQNFNIRQIDLEFSFKKKNVGQFQSISNYFKQGIIKEQTNEQVPLSEQEVNQIKRIPLLVESVIGAQMSDSVQPCYLAHPDTHAFSSNYPQPEFVFKNYSNKLFIPQQFVIRSKENREWNGVPISQGVIFIADSLEDLQNTKQFSKFTEKEYKQWKKERDQYSAIPLLPNEPVAFFDLDDKTEIVITPSSQKACRFIKFIPTAFRKKPINFTSKPFHSNQAECQFFGVNGIEIESDQRGIQYSQQNQILTQIKELEISLNGVLSEKTLGQVGEIEKVHIQELRNAKVSNSSVSILALSELKLQNLVGVSRQSVILKEEHSEDIEELTLTLPSDIQNDLWELQGVSIAIKTFTNETVVFADPLLQENKPRIRHYLLDPTQFDKVLKQLLDLIQDEELDNEQLKLSALNCLLKFIRSIRQDKNKGIFMRNFKEFTNIQKVLGEQNFLQSSKQYQESLIQFLDIIDLLNSETEYLGNFIETVLGKLLQKNWKSQSLQSVFDLIKYTNKQKKQSIQNHILSLLLNEISNTHIPKLQTEENIIVRSKLNINAFPFEDSQYLDNQSQQQMNQYGSGSGKDDKIIDGYLRLINCSFEIHKINTFYSYHVDLRSDALVEKLKLYFEQDTKSLYKIAVKIIVPDSKGNEQMLLLKKFDENTFTNVCEKAHMQENVKYFETSLKKENKAILDQQEIQINTSSLSEQESNKLEQIQEEKKELQQVSPDQQSQQQSSENLNLNCLTLDLHGYIGRYLKIQLEFLESYRSVHKAHTCTQILVRPEFYGTVLNQGQSQQSSLAENKEDSQNKKYSTFKIQEADSSYLLSSKTLGNIQYQIYQIPHDPLSRINKAFLWVMPQQQQNSKIVQDEQELSVVVQQQEQLAKDRKELQELLDEYIINPQQVSKVQLQNKVQEVARIQQQLSSRSSSIKATSGEEIGVTLSYVLYLADQLSGQIVQFIKQSPEIWEECESLKDLKSVYIKVFIQFGINDQLTSFPSIQKFLDLIFKQIANKSEFAFEILKEFIFQPQNQINTNSNLTNIIKFIQNLQILDFNDFLTQFLKFIGYADQEEENEYSFQVINSEKEVKSLIQDMQSKRQMAHDQYQQCTVNQLIPLLKLLEDLKIAPQEAVTNADKQLQVALLFKLLSHYIQQNYSKQSFFNQKSEVLIHFSLTLILKYLSLPQTNFENVFKNCQKSIVQIILISLQFENKQISKCLKQILLAFVKKDNQNILSKVIGCLMAWFKDRQNCEQTLFYFRLEQKQQGDGLKLWIKHISQVFKLYTKILKNSKVQEQQLEETYKQLGEIMTDVLQALAVNDDDKSKLEGDDESVTVVWIQLYQSLSYLDYQTLQKKNVFEQLAKKFFKLPQILQEFLYPKFHMKSQKYLENSLNKDPSILISILKAFLKEGLNVEPKICFCFCDGILNIIQSGKKETQSQSQIQAKFSDESVEELFIVLSSFLNEHINKGIYSGVTGAYVSIIMHLDLAIQMASILLNAQDNKKQNAFENYLKNNSGQIPLIQQTIHWLFLNSQPTKTKSAPSSEKIYNLSQLVEQILYKIEVSQEIISQSLPILMKTVLKIDEKLRNLINGKKINCERAVQVQKNCNTLFLNLFKTWVQNDIIAKQFLTDLNGFDFLLDRLFAKIEDQRQQLKIDQEVQDSSLGLESSQDLDNGESEEDNEDLEGIMNSLKSSLQYSAKDDVKGVKIVEKKPLPGSLPPISKKQTAIIPSTKYEEVKVDETNKQEEHKALEQALQSEDFGRNMKLIWSSDKEKQVASIYATTQWSKFKNGTKNRIYNYQMTNNMHEYEYVLQYDLEKIIQISELQVGILYNWSTYDVDHQYEPLSFIVEGSNEKDKEAQWRVLMKPIQDGGYQLNSINVYGYNFIENKVLIDKVNNLEETLASIGCKECRYLTLRFRKPLMSCLESSLYISCLKKIKSYGISFISVNGICLEDKQVYPYLIELQKDNSLEVLSKFFSGEFTEAFGLIADQPQIIEKIKFAFDKLSTLLDHKAALVKPIFLSLCMKNQSLSNWIMMERLISIDANKIKKEQIKFLGDIISSNSKYTFEKLEKIKEFLIFQVNRVTKEQIQLTHDQQILFSRYINLYSSKFREYTLILQSEQQEQEKKLENIVLGYKIEDLESIILMMQSCEAGKSKMFNSLNKLALLLLIPPSPFVNETISLEEYFNNLISSEDQQKASQFLLFSSIIGSNIENVINTILEKGKIEWTVQKLKESSKLTSIDTYQLCQVLYNCSKSQKFREKYRTFITNELYEILKEQDQNRSKLLKNDISDDHVKLIVQTIRDIVIGGEKEEEELTVKVKNDLIEASEKQDVAFINKVIVPILHAEENIPICISIYNPSNKKEKGLMPIYSSQDVESKGPSFFLKTDILNSKQKAALMKNFKDISADKVDNFNKLITDTKWEMIFQTKQSNIDSTKFRPFVQATQNKQNLFILVQANMNGQKVVLGGFCSKQFPNLGDTWTQEYDYQIPFGEANFVFYYTPEKELHFTMTHNKPFGYIYTDYEQGGALSVSGDFFLISWSYEFQNSCGNIYDMKCIEDPQIMTFYSNMEILNCEIWWANLSEKAKIQNGKVKQELKTHRWYKDYSPYNFFRENLIFEVNKNLKLSKIAQDILGKSQIFINYNSKQKLSDSLKIGQLYEERNVKTDPILDLVVLNLEESKSDAILTSQEKVGEQKLQKTAGVDNLFQQLLTQPVGSPAKVESNEKKDGAQGDTPSKQDIVLIEERQEDQKIQQPLLKRFEELGGVLDLIKAAKSAVKLYKSDKLREMWGLWLSEIESFSQLPTFFSTFSRLDTKKEVILYQLLDGEFDREISGDPQRILAQQEDLHIEMVKYSYQIVNEVFDKHEGADLRDMCLNNGTFERFIERIGQLSSEKRRVKIVKEQMDQKVDKEDQAEEKSKEKKKDDKKEKKKDDNLKKRKGVGYTTGTGTQWNVTEYLKSRESKTQQAANIVNIMKNVIKSRDWQAPPAIKNLILESALLPTLESALRSGSLLEMAKDYELNMAYLGFVQEVVKHETLIDVLLDIGEEYEPRQKESIQRLLEKLNELSSIFLGCLTSDQANKSQEQDDKENKPKLLALKIQQTQKLVQEKLALQAHIKEQQSIQEILSLPLSDAYYKVLSSLRFEYMNMKESSGFYTHAYQMEISKHLNPPVTKLVRLAQEIADLSNSLPCDYTNGIFCRVDKERVDLMKCMIMGASGTPYAHGAFVYDLFFENTYPNVPPKCQLITTGGQTVRFNPNLYNNGKVCLSLLGTWRGSSTENWDPKLSTILQVLLSIQAIIMSNEVYFNEPGYEHEQGTPEGEKKNEGYANIVRYCNVKFAIIDAIKNPPKGFEKVIKRNYYLKKNEILKEVKEWVDKAKTVEATYTGLVYDHNYQWAPQISAPGKYPEMMEQIYKELKETLESIKSPFEDESTGQVIERKFSKGDWENEEAKNQMKGGTNQVKIDALKFDDIDVSYDSPQLNEMKNININDEKILDRWSRYIGAMGKDAVAKQAESRILLLGMGPLGIEIAKNIVLAGCKELIIYDDRSPSFMDLGGGQFFLTEADIEDYQNNIDQVFSSKSRADYSKEKLQQLNFYVKVTVLPKDTKITEYLKQDALKDLKVIVLAMDITQISNKSVTEINQICRAKKIGFIHSCQNGLFARVFNDFGGLAQQVEGENDKKFVILDKNMEENQEVMIESIKADPEDGKGIVTLQEGYKHKFEDGDKVVIKEVVGMKKINSSGEKQMNSGIGAEDDQGESINNTIHTIKQISPSKFKIEKILGVYEEYQGNGLARQIKVPKLLDFKSYSQIYEEYRTEKEKQEKEGGKFSEFNFPLDQQFMIADFEKMDNFKFGHWCYQAVLEVNESLHENNYVFEDGMVFQDLEAKVLEKVLLIAKQEGLDLNDEKLRKKLWRFVYTFLLTLESYFAPIAAFIGGIVSQEVIKAITQKFVPIQQFMYLDQSELFPEFQFETSKDKVDMIYKVNEQLLLLEPDRYLSLRICLGNDNLKKLQNSKVFMIGAGAIGCELLKNYAMLGLGSENEGHIILTDPDVIEVSNLNRQFLFREKHLRKPKSQTAAASVIQMNKNLKDHIYPRLDKIHDSTSHIYNEEFFQSQTLVTNALDNVQARLYIDNKCVQSRVPLIDSGTLGPKGHVQIIVPYKTESYASQNDPEDNTQIPHCTLKMFPEETLHCVEWAKDIFGHLFTLQSQNYNKHIIAEIDQEPNFSDQQEIVQIRKVLKTIKASPQSPQDFDQCIQLARLRFQKHFFNDIKQLLHVYPLDKQTKEGRPFWSLPKRPPHPIEFNPKDPLHQNCIASTACLFAKIYNVTIPYDKPRSKEAKEEIALKASKCDVPEFIINEFKTSQIESKVEKESNKVTEENDQQEQQQSQTIYNPQQAKKEYDEIIKPLKQKLKISGQNEGKMQVEEFEKDADDNFHVDFIHALANIRASNYKLEEMDWLTVKIKAGRIIPALATTTAAISALQTIELIKIILSMPIEQHRNYFLNLAVPSMMCSEPGAPIKTKIKEGLEVTLWDRWEMKDCRKDIKLWDIVTNFEQEHKLSARDAFVGSIPLFLHSIQGKDDQERKKNLSKPLNELISIESAKSFMDLTITFVDENGAKDSNGQEIILKGIPSIRVYFKSD